jgi:ABC-type glutathione transport system ATPase component
MGTEETTSAGQPTSALIARHLIKQYERGLWFSRNRCPVMALDDVSLALERGATLAVVGESGSGKSTLARCLARLEKLDSGEVLLNGENLWTLPKHQLFRARRQIQLILQDSSAAMNPRFRAVELVGEPLRIQKFKKKQRRELALAMLERVGIPRHWAYRLPAEFSGGQRQRLLIARALVLNPSVLILDEALSGLDLSIQAQIANLLIELQECFRLTYLYITHDLRLAGHLAHRMAVMHRGRIVELATPLKLFSHPQHAHTRVLLATTPGLAGL